MLPTLGVHLHDIPDSARDYERVLHNAITLALNNQSPEGAFEVAGQVADIGDNSLGVSSLLAFSWQRSGRTDSRLPEPFVRSVDWFLAHRVYREDNPGYAHWLRIRNSGEAYARFQITDFDITAFGDWPTTAWALLQVGNVVKYGDGLLRDDQRDALLDLGLSYWTWLTEVSEFNIQDADNQAIGSVIGAVEVSKQLARSGRAAEADVLRNQALHLYREVLRPHRETDRGYTYFGEHSAGFDQNYGSICLSFLYAAYLVTGEEVFYQDGLEMARYLDMRLSARGFDYGGPRYFEKHAGFEAVLGLRAYSGVIRSDLGRFLGDERLAYYYNVGETADSQPNGHFAFMTIWTMEDQSEWYRSCPAVAMPFKLSLNETSIVFGSDHTPYLITAGGAEVLEGIVDGVHGIGLTVAGETEADRTLLTPLPTVSPAIADENLSGVTVRLVTHQLAHQGRTVEVRTAYLLDGNAIRILTAYDGNEIDRTQVAYLAGLPYLTDDPQASPRRGAHTWPSSGQRKLRTVHGQGGGVFFFGADGESFADPLGLTAGTLIVEGGAGMRVVNPSTASTFAFNCSETVDSGLQEFASAIDHQNHNQGWANAKLTNWLLAPVEDTVTRSGRTWGLLTVTYRRTDEPVTSDLDNVTNLLRRRLTEPEHSHSAYAP